MSERLSTERLEHLRRAFAQSPYWTVEKELYGHISALESDLAAANERLRLAEELADALDLATMNAVHTINLVLKYIEGSLADSLANNRSELLAAIHSHRAAQPDTEQPG